MNGRVSGIIRSFILAVGLLISLKASVRAAPRSTDHPLVGDWVGGFGQGSNYTFLRLHFESKEGKLSGTYDVPLMFQRGRSIGEVTVKSTKVSFGFADWPKGIVFDGKVKSGVLSGEIVQQGAFRFTKVAAITPQDYAGTYQIGAGHYLFLRPTSELGIGALHFMDFHDGRIALLFPTSTREFFTGHSVLVPHPIAARAIFSLDPGSRATGFAWTDAEKWRARRIKFREEELSFTNNAIKISGALILPQNPTPHPAIVCVAGGTAAGDREMFRYMAEFFAAQGIASLIYDKRGLGSSTGDWLEASFDDLAGDALAAVQFLKSRAGIDPKRIGLFGASQSGWIVALAASKSRDIGFIISQSGPGVTPEEQELYRSEAWLRADGFREDEVQEAMKFIRQRYECALTGVGWDALADVEHSISNKTWFAYVGSIGPDDPFWKFWKLIRTYDPVPVLEKVTCPVLAVFGAKDTFLPAEKSAHLWDMALRRAGNMDVTIRLFADADHSLIESKTGGIKDAAQARRFAPGFFETIREWTRNHVK